MYRYQMKLLQSHGNCDTHFASRFENDASQKVILSTFTDDIAEDVEILRVVGDVEDSIMDKNDKWSITEIMEI